MAIPRGLLLLICLCCLLQPPFVAPAQEDRQLDQFEDARYSIGGPEEASVNYGASMLFTAQGIYKAVLLRATAKDPQSGEQVIRASSTIKLFDEHGDITDKIAGERVNYIYPVTWLDYEERVFHSYLVAQHFPGQYSVFEILEGGVLSQLLRVEQGHQSGQIYFMDLDDDKEMEVVLLMRDFLDPQGESAGECWYRGKYLQFPREAEESHVGAIVVELYEKPEQAFTYRPQLSLE